MIPLQNWVPFNGGGFIASNNQHLASATIIDPSARSMQLEVRLTLLSKNKLRCIHRNPIHLVWLQTFRRNLLHTRNLPSVTTDMGTAYQSDCEIVLLH